MNIKQMIAEWRKGCGNTQMRNVGPVECKECTTALIDAIEKRASSSLMQLVDDYAFADIPQSETTKHYKGAIGDMKRHD